MVEWHGYDLSGSGGGGYCLYKVIKQNCTG